MKYKYLFVLDFEATCDEPVNPYPQEIIEFPVQVVDIQQQKVIDTFHQYIKPEKHPQLTNFCTNLTGITQDTVDKAKIFTEVLADFENWLQDKLYDNFIIVTCGNWDLSNLLPAQCTSSNVPIPLWGKEWINLKTVFSQANPSYSHNSKSMMKMLEYLAIPHIGKHHSGIDDVRNLSNIVIHLLQKGAEFKKHDSSDNTPASFKPGDWLCPNCKEHNFANRNNCFGCGYQRTQTNAALKPGDWMCPNCNEVNFARRTSCYGCGKARR